MCHDNFVFYLPEGRTSSVSSALVSDYTSWLYEGVPNVVADDAVTMQDCHEWVWKCDCRYVGMKLPRKCTDFSKIRKEKLRLKNGWPGPSGSSRSHYPVDHCMNDDGQAVWASAKCPNRRFGMTCNSFSRDRLDLTLFIF